APYAALAKVLDAEQVYVADAKSAAADTPGTTGTTGTTRTGGGEDLVSFGWELLGVANKADTGSAKGVVVLTGCRDASRSADKARSHFTSNRSAIGDDTPWNESVAVTQVRTEGDTVVVRLDYLRNARIL